MRNHANQLGLLLLLCVTASAHAASPFGTCWATNETVGPQTTLTVSVTPTYGPNQAFIGFARAGSGTSITFSDAYNTWAPAGAFFSFGGSNVSQVAYALNIHSVATYNVTATFSGSVSYASITVCELFGIGALDAGVESNTISAGGLTATSPGFGTANANEIVLGIGSIGTASGTSTVGLIGSTTATLASPIANDMGLEYANFTSLQNGITATFNQSPATYYGLTVVGFTAAAPSSYYMSTSGSDANNGSSGSPWASPNHSLNCGDTITASAGSYAASNFNTGDWGTVFCFGNSNVAWLQCATFDACKVSASSANGMWVSSSNWGVQGWEVAQSGSTETSCFQAVPPNGGSTSVRNIIFANDIANGCEGGGFAAYGGATYSADYVAFIGNIAYNAAQNNGECFSGFNVANPIQADTIPGTHFYIAGNFAWDNVDPNPCSGGAPTDGEGITYDSLDIYGYTQQVVAQNNILFLNGSAGIKITASTGAKVYVVGNTSYGNSSGAGISDAECGEFVSQNSSAKTEYYFNLARTNASTGCGGYSNYLFFMVSPFTEDAVYRNYGYSAAGYNTTVSSGNFVFGPSNTFGIDPAFTNAPATNPGAPACGSYSSVPACMAAIVADFVPTVTAAKIYGYQAPSTTSRYDSLYPQWLCNVTNLPPGLVTPGCTVGMNGR